MEQIRETAGVTLRAIVRYVRARGGDTAVAHVLNLAGEHEPPEAYDDARRWWSYETKINVFGAAAQVLGDESVGLRVGQSILSYSVNTPLRLGLLMPGGPTRLIRLIATTSAKFNTTADMSTLSTGHGAARVQYRLRAGYRPSRYDCDYTRGLLTQLPALFGLPAATVTHDICQVEGAEACVYTVRWRQRRLLSWPRAGRDIRRGAGYCAGVDTRTSEPAVGVTPNLFGIAYGLTGLAGCWGYAALLHFAPAVVSDILCVLAAAVWLTLLAAYVSQVPRRPGGWAAELSDPVLGPFVALIPIVGMLLAIGLMRHERTAGQWLFGVFAAVTIVLAGWMTGQWISAGLDPDKLHPGYVLPSVAGGLIAAIGAALAGWPGPARVCFGLGVVSWLVIDSMILARLYFRPPLPPQLRPTLAIQAAPPALAGLAYLAVTHNRVDAVTFGLAGYTLLAALVQLRLIGVYRRLHFTSGFWAYAFPYAAVATFTLHWVAYAHPPGYRIWAWIVILAITAFVAALAAETTAALARHRFLPQLR